MRVSFSEGGFVLSPSEMTAAFSPIVDRFHIQWSVHYSRQRKRVGIFVSRLDHCLTDLLWRWKSGELAMEIPFIISNHPDMEVLAQMYHIPYYYMPVQRERRGADQQRILDFVADKVDF